MRQPPYGDSTVRPVSMQAFVDILAEGSLVTALVRSGDIGKSVEGFRAVRSTRWLQKLCGK